MNYLELTKSIDRGELFKKVYKVARYHYYELKHNVIPLYEFGKNDGGIYREDESEKAFVRVGFLEYKTRRQTEDEFVKAFNTKRLFNQPTGLAIITGSVSNVIALDIDDYKNEFITPAKLISPLTDKTPNGGRHSYFTYDKSLDEIATTSKGAKTFLHVENFQVEVLLNQLVLVKPSMVLSKDGTFIGEYEYTTGDRSTFKALPLLKADDIREYLEKLSSAPTKTFTTFENKILATEVMANSNLMVPYLQDWFPQYLNLPASTPDRQSHLLKLADSMFHYAFNNDLVLSAVKYAYSTFQRHDPEYSDQKLEELVREAQNFIGTNTHTFKTPIVTAPLQFKTPEIKTNQTLFKIKSGFSTIDETIGGFRSSSCYLVGGYEKSGKSSFLAKMALNMMGQKNKVGVLHTELIEDEINTLFAAIYRNETKDAVEDDDMGKSWRKEYGDYIVTRGQRELLDSAGNLTFDNTLQHAMQLVSEGCKVIIFDNLTTYYNLAEKDNNWQLLGSCIQRVVDFTKKYNIVSFVVVHQKPEFVYTETPRNVKNYINEGNPAKIFDESVSVIQKPTGASIYGGGAAHSQLSGHVLVWRPYQKFTEEWLTEISAISLDSFGRAPSRVIRMDFHGAKGIFMETGKQPEKYPSLLPEITPRPWSNFSGEPCQICQTPLTQVNKEGAVIMVCPKCHPERLNGGLGI